MKDYAISTLKECPWAVMPETYIIDL
jgi:tubulin---tyrosine ligase